MTTPNASLFQAPSTFGPERGASTAQDRFPAPLTRLIGREAEVAAVEQLLAATRFLTLTGTGGSGKTRLALQIGVAVRERFPDGVFFVPLAAISDPDLVLPAVAETLGLKEAGSVPLIDLLIAALSPCHALFILDNFEQIVVAAPLIADLLAACPRLQILVTSRAPLHVSGEQEYPVLPLMLPSAEQLRDVETLAHVPAVALFVERAQAILPDFALTAGNAGAVAAICARLDGLPLAIELAAARIKLLPPSALLSRLERSLTLLTSSRRDVPVRQQTLRRTIDWSYDLLTPEEQALFARLAMFAGGGTLAAAEAICGGPDAQPIAMLDGLGSLVDKSLIRHVPSMDGEPRFGMLETIREYAREQLTTRGEHERIARAHAAYYLSLAEEAEPQLIGPEQGAWLTRLEEEHDNLRAALGWALRRGETETGLRLGAALWRFWDVRGYRSEGRRWLEMALGSSDDAAGGAALRARALQAAGLIAGEQGDYAAAQALHEESLTLRRVLGDKLGIAHCLSNLGIVATARDDYAAARALNEESLALKRELGDKRGVSNSLSNLGVVAFRQGDSATARALHEESLALRRELGDKRGIASSLSLLGVVAFQQGDYNAARVLHEESLALKRELGDKRGIASSLSYLGSVAGEQGDNTAEQTLQEQSLALRRELGDKPGIANSLTLLGAVARRQGDYAMAQALLEESLALRRELGNRRGIAWSLTHLGILATEQGDYAAAQTLQGDAIRALRHFAQSLPLAMAIRSVPTAITCLEGFAQIAVGQGDDARAVRLWAAAATLRDTMGAPLPPTELLMHERSSAAVRARLDDVRWASARAEGATMSIEQAVAYACQAQVPQDPALASPQAVHPAGLSAREVEVLRLLAAGKTNRQIADALFLAPGTINVHVTHILTKTNTTNRTEAALFARDHGLA